MFQKGLQGAAPPGHIDAGERTQMEKHLQVAFPVKQCAEFEQKILKLFPRAFRTNPDVGKEHAREALLPLLSPKTSIRGEKKLVVSKKWRGRCLRLR